MAKAWEERWILGDRLGKGGQGVAHIATFRQDPAIKGALKYLKNNRDPQARGRMAREVVSLQTLAKAGGAVPNVLDHNTGQFGDPNVELFVVMDLIPGVTLTEYVNSRRGLRIEEAAQFTLSLCKTIQLAHKAPILHRDLKPDNIIVRDPSKHDLVVVDYGLSFNSSDEALTETEETFRNRFLDLPETNTPGGDRRDPRSDLTAVCAILYYCLSGNVPGQLQDGTGALPHMRKGFSLREKLSDKRVPALEEFLNRGFAPILGNRFQTVEEIQGRLCEFLAKDDGYDSSDPVQVAAVLSAQLRANDRATQLAEFRDQTGKLFQHLQQLATKYGNQLSRFKLGWGGMGFGGMHIGNNALPHGLDLVQQSPTTLVLQADNHPLQRYRQYSVASRGEQCVVLAADWKLNTSQQQRAAPPALSWQEIAWYEGNPETVFDLVSVNLRDWVTAQLKDIVQEILGK